MKWQIKRRNSFRNTSYENKLLKVVKIDRQVCNQCLKREIKRQSFYIKLLNKKVLNKTSNDTAKIISEIFGISKRQLQAKILL